MAVETAKKQGSIKPRRMKAPKPFKKRIEPWLWLMPALVFFLVFTYGQYILGKPANGLGNRAIYQPAAS